MFRGLFEEAVAIVDVEQEDQTGKSANPFFEIDPVTVVGLRTKLGKGKR